MKNKVVVFTIADDNNMKYAGGLKNSFKRFHPDVEFRIIGSEHLKNTGDPHIFYRATPYFGLMFLQQGYDTVIKIDSDSVITGDISHVWEGEYDVATVHNSNPKEVKKVVVTIQGVDPLEYQNCGFVAMKNIEFVKFWMALCLSPRFNAFQYREQDILNNIIYWGQWAVRFLDAGNQWHGLVSRGYELNMEVRDNKLVLPKNDTWPKEDRQIVCWHHAGGSIPIKMNFNILFKKEVAKWLNDLIK